jgi:hypothetical protein
MPACFAWIFPCVHSARNVDTDGTTISSTAKNDGKAAQFEKNLEKTGQDTETNTSDMGAGKGSENCAGSQQSNDSSGQELRQEKTPWIVKEAASDRGKQQSGAAISLVGQVGSLHRQEESSPHCGDEDDSHGKMFFEARSTPRWGQQSSPAKPSGKSEDATAPAVKITSSHLQTGEHNSKVRPCEIGAPILPTSAIGENKTPLFLPKRNRNRP